MLDAGILASSLVRGGELLVAESFVVGNIIDHSRPIRAKQSMRLFKIDQRARGLLSRAGGRLAGSYAP